VVVDVRRRREGEVHPHDGSGLPLQEDAADHARALEVLGPHLHLVDPDFGNRAGGKGDRERVHEPEVVETLAAWSHRVDHGLHLVPVPEPNPVPEVVLDDREVVQVVLDVGGQVLAVPQSDDPLTGTARRLPVDLERNLIGLHQRPLVRVGPVQEEPHEAARFCRIRLEGRVDRCRRPQIPRPLQQSHDPGLIPRSALLGRGLGGGRGQGQGQGQVKDRARFHRGMVPGGGGAVPWHAPVRRFVAGAITPGALLRDAAASPGAYSGRLPGLRLSGGLRAPH